jgi:hypothetical protein
MFEPAVLSQIALVAKTYRIDLAALLAVVEIESDGHSLESDGKTPSFLFEKHVFYRQLLSLTDRDKADAAVRAGLAYVSWQPSTEYRNEATSKQRLELLAQARAINEEAADRACSWGVGQTMGENCRDLGFVDARHMVAFMIAGGVPAQVECLIREIEHSNLTRHLNAHEWAAFARGYNGAGYQRNHYDSRLAVAYSRWAPKAKVIAAMAAPATSNTLVPEAESTGQVPAPPQPRPEAPKPVTVAETPPALGILARIKAFFT